MLGAVVNKIISHMAAVVQFDRGDVVIGIHVQFARVQFNRRRPFMHTRGGGKILFPIFPAWKRSVFYELLDWVVKPPAHRAIMLSGPRQVGKTTLLLQTIDQLIKNGVPPTNILYATFDHPIFKLAGLDAVLEAWRELGT